VPVKATKQERYLLEDYSRTLLLRQLRPSGTSAVWTYTRHRNTLRPADSGADRARGAKETWMRETERMLDT